MKNDRQDNMTSRMTSKLCIICCFLLIQAAPVSVLFARPVNVIPFSEQMEKADLVVIAHPESPTIHKFDPRRKPDDAIEVTTKFTVETVIKGDPMVRQFTLRHHEYNDLTSHVKIRNRAGYIRFAKNDGRPYLMFLKRSERDGYIPYCGQFDPGVSIRVLQFRLPEKTRAE